MRFILFFKTQRHKIYEDILFQMYELHLLVPFAVGRRTLPNHILIIPYYVFSRRSLFIDQPPRSTLYTFNRDVYNAR